MMIGSRLTDPTHCCPEGKLDELKEKVSSCMTRLFRLPVNGGNPFLFGLSAPKPHELRDKIGFRKITTAATDGRKFYWSPEFLGKLNKDELATVMMHESYHVIFFHSVRGKGLNQDVYNVSVDYVVNACIWIDHEKVNRKSQLWGGNLGDPISLKELLDWIDATQDKLPEGVFADKSLHGRSPESIYDEIMQHVKDSPRRCPKCGALNIDPKTGKPANQPGKGQGQPQQDQGNQPGQGNQSQSPQGNQQGQGQPQNQPGCGCGDDGCCPHCGAQPNPMSSLDNHIDSTVDKSEVMSDVMRAAQQAERMKGSVPGEIQDMLGELSKPVLRFQDLVRSAMLRKVTGEGMKNDWKRMRRRWLAATPQQFLPRRHTHMPRWACLLDTSGSMSDKDIAYGLSQLQALGNHTEGLVIPVDAQVYWSDATPIRDMTDIKRTKVVGRGGTVLRDFFAYYRNHIGSDFDVIIVITDGYIDEIPIELKPPTDVVFVLVNNYKDFKVPFGRVAPLRIEHL